MSKRVHLDLIDHLIQPHVSCVLIIIGCININMYGCQLWNPFTQKDIHLLEKIQFLENIYLRAIHWVCGSRWDPSEFSWTKSSDQCLHQLRLPSLKLQCKYLSVNLLYDIIKNKITVKLSDFCSFESSCTKQHSLLIFPLHSQSTHCNTLETYFIWNKIPFNILSITNHNAFCRAVLLFLVLAM